VSSGLLLCQPLLAEQSAVREQLPDKPDVKARYVIYLHGKIIEDEGRRPTSPTWGVYEYDQILKAIANDGLVVISEQRPPMTDMDQFAKHVADQVQRLLRAGVPAEQVSVVGFSKGGGIAIRTSALLQNPGINFVFLAACGNGDFSKTDIKVAGRILSIFEASDEVGRSCASLFAKPGSTGMRSEIEINIGEHHGSFFRPHAEWLAPALRWIHVQ
jgi:dienelactone hydrolase